MKYLNILTKTLILGALIIVPGVFLVGKSGLIESFDALNFWPCSRPILYSIGTIDPRFEISENELKDILSQAEVIWEKPLNKNLFQYDAQSQLKINLVFDERQKQTLDSENLETKLEILESTRESIVEEYDKLSDEYNQMTKAYNAHKAEYEKKLKKYNDDVKHWNSQGGAPKDEYEDLQTESKELKEMYDDLEDERSAINKLAGKTNTLVKKENEVVSTYNTNLETYKNKYGSAREFEKGVYNGKEINIYEFKEQLDLRLTLVHEFGHALGIGHLQNEKSIMYYLMGEQDMTNPKLAEEDIGALKTACRIK